MEQHALPAPLIVPPRADLPVLLSIPHSGRDYPAWLVQLASSGRRALESLEDPLVDRLAWRAMAHGIGAVIARAPRAAVDCNRSPQEIDPAVITGGASHGLGPRARAGLGIVPGRTVQHGRLWRRPITSEELDRRLAQAHMPYHQALTEGLKLIRARHGQALLIDCHSMPPRRAGQAAIVLGDRHGRSAEPWLVAEAARIVTDAGWTAAINDPYAGGHIVERHGRPHAGVHAIQVEIDRGCYLARDLRTAGTGFDRAAQLLERLVLGLANAVGVPPAIAAE